MLFKNRNFIDHLEKKKLSATKYFQMQLYVFTLFKMKDGAQLSETKYFQMSMHLFTFFKMKYEVLFKPQKKLFQCKCNLPIFSFFQTKYNFEIQIFYFYEIATFEKQLKLTQETQLRNICLSLW